ncbi:MAG TPA: peptidylprolyl isomerase [Flavipsychrobacter sp.]|nr:peptidylprolyl isomerase [Flavipsychrobacter sp.]
MQEVKAGDMVSVHYHGRLNNGTTFDSSEGRDPLSFEVGKGMVIKGFDDALLGMRVGDKKTVNIPVDQAYGERNDGWIMEYPLSDFPDDMKPELGMQLNMSDNQGNNFPVIIAEIKEDAVVLDGNHPLAGQNLIFDIELVTIG